MTLLEEIKKSKIFGIIREDNPKKALEIASAYIEGGLKIIELNAPFEVTQTLSKYEDLILIQGGIITRDQAQLAIECGAKMISSPIFQDSLIRLSICRKIPLIPSVTTPNEAYEVWKRRIPLIKIYPVAGLGGVKYIKDIIKPMPFLNLLPAGFVKIEDIKEYLKAGAYCVGIGREFYNKNSFDEIVNAVKSAMEMVR